MNEYLLRYISTISSVNILEETQEILNFVAPSYLSFVIGHLNSKIKDLSQNMSPQVFVELINKFGKNLGMTESDRIQAYTSLAAKDPQFVIDSVATITRHNPRAKKLYAPPLIESAKAMESINAETAIKIYNENMHFLQFRERSDILKRIQKLRTAPLPTGVAPVPRTMYYFDTFTRTNFDDFGRLNIIADIKNVTETVFTNCTIEIDPPPEAFRATSTRYSFGQINPKESRGVAFNVVPKTSGKFAIKGSLTFYDTQNNKQLVPLPAVNVDIPLPTLRIGKAAPRSLLELEEMTKTMSYVFREFETVTDQRTLVNELNQVLITKGFKQYLFDTEQYEGRYYSSFTVPSTSEQIPIIIYLSPSPESEIIRVDAWVIDAWVNDLVGFLLSLEQQFTIREEPIQVYSCPGCMAPVEFEAIAPDGKYMCKHCRTSLIITIPT